MKLLDALFWAYYQYATKVLKERDPKFSIAFMLGATFGFLLFFINILVVLIKQNKRFLLILYGMPLYFYIGPIIMIGLYYIYFKKKRYDYICTHKTYIIYNTKVTYLLSLFITIIILLSCFIALYFTKDVPCSIK